MWKYLIAKLRNNRGQVNATADVGNQPGANQSSSQGLQGDKLEGMVRDIDFSDIPEERREEVKRYVANKVKLYDTAWQTKVSSLAEEKKTIEDQKKSLQELTRIQEEVSGNPELEQEISRLINKARAGISLKADSNKEKSDSLKLLDRRIKETSDADTRETLKELREIIAEETNINSLYEKINNLEQTIAGLQSITRLSATEKVNVGIKQLNDRFGSDIVGKYEGELRKLALQYPTQGVQKLFYHIADENDIRTALLAEEKLKHEKEVQRKEQGSAPFSRSVSTPIEVKKDKFGRVNFGDIMRKKLAAMNG